MSANKKSAAKCSNSKANALLEPELRRSASGYDAKKRIRVGKKLARWSEQLQTSGQLLLAASSVTEVDSPHVNGKVSSLNAAKITIDASLDPDLREEVAKMNSDERRKMMNTFQRWADQLARTLFDLKQAEMANDKTNLILN